MTSNIPPSRLKELNDAMRKAVEAWNAEQSLSPHRAAKRMLWRLLDVAAVALALSFIVPAFIVIGPELGRAYVCVWKAALGYEDCFTPPFLRDLDKRDGRLPTVDSPPADKAPLLQRDAP